MYLGRPRGGREASTTQLAPSLAIGIVAALLLAGPSGVLAAQPLLAEFQTATAAPVHPAISIDGDDGFARPLSGVRSGTGTAADPYVIGPWHILHTNSSAIRIANTTKHVVIRDVYVNGVTDTAARQVQCPVWAVDCSSAAAIRVVDSDHVAIERLRAVRSTIGVFILRSSDVELRDSVLGLPAPVGGSIGDGLRVFGSRNVTVRNLTVIEPEFPLLITSSDRVTISNSTFEGGRAYSNLQSSENVTIVSTIFAGQPAYMTGNMANLTFVGNRVSDAPLGVKVSDGTANTVPDAYICGNSFERILDAAIYLRGAHRSEIVANRIDSAADGIFVQFADDIELRSNDVRVNDSALALAGSQAVAWSNAFVGARTHVLDLGLGINASGNWWGAADGPSGAGRGTGTSLVVKGAVTFAPWLSAPPPFDPTCDLAYGAPGSSYVPTPPGLAHPSVGMRAEGSPGTTLHPSIRIEHNEDFASPFSGVRSGRGTMEDPYVISGWSILHTHGAGIRIAGTDAHVIVRDVLIGGLEADVAANAECLGLGDCAGTRGIEIERASNVTVENARIVQELAAVRVVESDRVTMRGLDAGLGNLSATLGYGVFIRGSSDVVVESSYVRPAVLPVWVEGGRRVTLRGSTFEGSELGSSIQVLNSTGLLLHDNVARQAGVFLTRANADLRIVGNEFAGGTKAVLFVSTEAGASLRDVDLCRNVITGTAGREAAVYLPRAENITVRGNVFDGNENSLYLIASNVTVEQNRILHSSQRGLRLSSAGVQVHNNSFISNAGGNLITRDADARFNWWNSALGPSGAGDGDGDALHLGAFGPVVEFEPFLTVEPSYEVDCGVR